MARGFNGTTTNYLSLGDSASVDITSQYLTISAWAYINSWGERMIIAKAQNSASQVQYCLAINASNQFFGQVGDGASFDNVLSSGGRVASRWYHVVLVKTPTLLRIWVDNVLSGQSSSTRTIQNTALSCNIGRRSDALHAWDGALALIAMWDTPLDDDAIRKLYYKPYGVPEVANQNLRGFWPLDDGNGNARDLSRYNQSATLNGTVSFTDNPPVSPDRVEGTLMPSGLVLKRPGSVPRIGVVFNGRS